MAGIWLLLDDHFYCYQVTFDISSLNVYEDFESFTH